MKKWFIKTFKQRKTNFMSFLRDIYIYMKTVTMIDSYKERNGYLCWFLSVFLNNIFKRHAIWQ